MTISRLNAGYQNYNTYNKVQNTNFSGRRKAEVIQIVGPTKGHRDRLDINVDGTVISFPEKYTLEKLLKSIDKLKNTYLGTYG